MTSAVEWSFRVGAVGISMAVIYVCGTFLNVWNWSAISLNGTCFYVSLLHKSTLKWYKTNIYWNLFWSVDRKCTRFHLFEWFKCTYILALKKDQQLDGSGVSLIYFFFTWESLERNILHTYHSKRPHSRNNHSYTCKKMTLWCWCSLHQCDSCLFVLHILAHL